MNYTYKIKKNRKTIQRCQTHALRRFTNSLRTINWKNGQIKVCLRVTYGVFKDNHGKLVIFYNDGIYETKSELRQAFTAFIEPDRANTDNVPVKN